MVAALQTVSAFPNQSAQTGETGLIPENGQRNTLCQTGIPLILVSSGNIGNNGALTAITTLPATYSQGCYMWFKTNSISAATPAGWYYVVMTSGTAGTIYNNTYTSGVPLQPAVLTAFVTTGPGAYTQTTGSNITAHSLLLPPQTLGNRGALFVSAMLSTINNADNKIYAAQLGATVIATNTYTTIQTARPVYQLQCQGSAYQISTATDPIGAGIAADWTRSALTSTAVQTFTTQLQLATATDWIAIESLLVETAYGD